MTFAIVSNGDTLAKNDCVGEQHTAGCFSCLEDQKYSASRMVAVGLLQVEAGNGTNLDLVEDVAIGCMGWNVGHEERTVFMIGEACEVMKIITPLIEVSLLEWCSSRRKGSVHLLLLIGCLKGAWS